MSRSCLLGIFAANGYGGDWQGELSWCEPAKRKSLCCLTRDHQAHDIWKLLEYQTAEAEAHANHEEPCHVFRHRDQLLIDASHAHQFPEGVSTAVGRLDV